MELRKIYPEVELFGQDDKAKIPVGNTVPVSIGVRANNRVIAPVGDNSLLQALDHNFHVGNITPSVTLRCNIPKEIFGSFLIRDDKDGYGQLFVTLRDSVFDPSEVFDHCAQLVDTLKTRGLKVTGLVLQTEGGRPRGHHVTLDRGRGKVGQ